VIACADTGYKGAMPYLLIFLAFCLLGMLVTCSL